MMSGGGGGGGGGKGGAAAVEVAEVAEPVKERDAFDIKLTVVDPKSKIKIIKEVRALTGLGLKEVSNISAAMEPNLCMYYYDIIVLRNDPVRSNEKVISKV